MSSPSDILEAQEQELEAKLIAIRKEQSEEIVDPDVIAPSTGEIEEITDLDKIAPSSNEESLIITEETQMPTFILSPKKIIEFPENIFIGGRCPQCKIQLHYNSLIKNASNQEVAFYKCRVDGYVLTMSH